MSLAIATPIRAAELATGLVTLGYSESIRVVARELPTEVLEGTLTFSIDQVRARNRIVGHVLRQLPQVTHLLFWDDDQFFENPHDGAKVIREMMRSGEDFIGAPYTNKRQPLRWVHQLLAPCPTPVNGVQEVKEIGMGMTLLTRTCLERLTQASTTYRDWPHPHKIGDVFEQLYDPVGPDPSEQRKLSEDFSCCKRWRSIGGRVCLYVGAGIVMHAGGHAWSAREMPGGVVG